MSLFNRKQPIIEQVPMMEIPAPFEVFNGSLRVQTNLESGNGLPGDFNVKRSENEGHIRGPLTDFSPGDDLSTTDIVNSVAEGRILLPSYRTKKQIPKLWGVIDAPERTVNTETEVAIFDLGRFCAESCVYIAGKLNAEYDLTYALDNEVQRVPGSFKQPRNGMILTRTGKSARLVPKPADGLLYEPTKSEDPLRDALQRIEKGIGSDDVCLVFSDFIDAETDHFDLIDRISKKIASRLWVVRPTADSQNEVIFDGASSLTTADYVLLNRSVEEQLETREEQIARLAGSRLLEVSMHSEDPFKSFAVAVSAKA